MTALFLAPGGEGKAVRDGTADDIVELALAIVDEETRAWLTTRPEPAEPAGLAGPAEGSPDVR